MATAPESETSAMSNLEDAEEAKEQPVEVDIEWPDSVRFYTNLPDSVKNS